MPPQDDFVATEVTPCWFNIFPDKKKICFMVQREVNSVSLVSGAAAENMLGSLLCLPGSGSVLLDPYGSTISETTSEAWSVEVLPSDSGGASGSFYIPLSPLDRWLCDGL